MRVHCFREHRVAPGAGCTALDMAKNRKRACAPDSKWRRAADLAVQLLRGVDTAEGTDSIARPGRPRQQPSKNHGHSVPFPMWTGAFTQPAPALASADDACVEAFLTKLRECPSLHLVRPAVAGAGEEARGP